MTKSINFNLLLALLLLTSCIPKNDVKIKGTSFDTIGSISLEAIAPLTLNANGSDQTTLRVLVKNTNGTPLSGKLVTLTIPRNGGTAPGYLRTDSDGIATFILTSSNNGGYYHYSATTEGAVSNSETLTFTGTAVFTWQTPTANASISLPLRSGYNYNFNVDWGDGSSSLVTSFLEIQLLLLVTLLELEQLNTTISELLLEQILLVEAGLLQTVELNRSSF